MSGAPLESADDDKPTTGSASHALTEAVNAAELLLAYAAEQGSALDQGLVEDLNIETIVRSKHTLTARPLNEDEESAFWESYRKLCAATSPVSRESLEATTPLPRRTMIFGKRAASQASDAVRYYQVITVVTLFVLLAFQVYWVFVSTLVTDVKKVSTEKASLIVALQTKSLEAEAAYRSEEAAHKEARDAYERTSNSPMNEFSDFLASSRQGEVLQELGSRSRVLRREVEKLRAEHDQTMPVLEMQYSSNIELLHKVNLLASLFSVDRRYAGAWSSIPSVDETAAESPTSTVDEDEGLLIQTGSISLEILSLYFLPILYGLVGACAYILRTISQQIKTRIFTSASMIRLQLRMVLGALAGLSIAWFSKGEGGGVGFLDNITPLALAFLAGYSVELLFAAMDTLIAAFSRERTTE